MKLELYFYFMRGDVTADELRFNILFLLLDEFYFLFN